MIDVILFLFVFLCFSLLYCTFLYWVAKTFAEDVRAEAEFWRERGGKPTPLPPIMHFFFKDEQK